MRILKLVLASPLLVTMAYAMPLNHRRELSSPATCNSLFPWIIGAVKVFDYRHSLKQQVLPDNLKQFEAHSRTSAIDPDKDGIR